MKHHPSLFPQFDQAVYTPAESNPVKQEKDRLNATARRLLAFLQERPGQWIDNTVLLEVAGFRYGGRLFELKQDGWLIERRHVEGGCWQYALMGRKEW